MRNYAISFVVGSAVLCVMAWLIMTLVKYPEIKYLPFYTFSTVFRIVITLVISVVWGVSFGVLAATNRAASLILTPFIDLLQSIPILGYFPLVIGFLFALGPLGVELSVILLLFTSMAWAIFFGVLGAIRGIPTNVVESARSFGLTGWRYIRHVVLPAIAPTVAAGANLAWCDGWFFVIAAEYIQYQGNIVPPPSGGLGYLLAKAAYYYKDIILSSVLLLFITFIVLFFNTLTWHRLMERAEAGTFKPILKMDLSGIGKLGVKISSWPPLGRLRWPKSFSIASQRLRKYSHIERILAVALASSAILFIFYIYIVIGKPPTLGMILQEFNKPPAGELGSLPVLIGLTIGRLVIAYGISLVVAIGLGVLAAEHKKAVAVIYPLYDIGQGVPILALFPVMFLGLNQLLSPRMALELTCIIMLVLDMIWYMFLNILIGIKNIPTEIKEVGQLFGFKGLKRITHIVIPAILPSIVTGSILSWGTGWNTIIFAEYMPSSEPTIPPLSVPGIGSLLDKAGYEYGNTLLLVFILGIIAAVVLLMEGLVWRPLLRKFERYHIEV